MGLIVKSPVLRLRFAALENVWSRPTGSLRLADGHVHVWRATPAIARRAELASDEARRAARLVNAGAFVGGRTLLRHVVSAYEGASPKDIVLAYGPNGKPRLASSSPLRFNLAHAGDVVLLAVANGLEVGVDVERLAPVPELGSVARLALTERERARLESFAEGDREERFIRLWCCKEAWGKWRGDGVAGLLEVEAELEREGEGGLWTLTPAAGYAAAVVAPGARAVELLEWV